MDLPPPPLFRHQHHHHLRYGNVLHPPDFLPPPYTHNLPPPPPPPQPNPPHILLRPPQLPPPPLHIAHPPLPSRVTFSPPHHPILERSHLYELDPPPKPYFHYNLAPPPPPRENLHLRLVRDYPERNPIFKDEIFRRGYSDNIIHGLSENRERHLCLDARELNTRVPDIGDHERYRHVFYSSRQLYDKRDDDEWGWDNDINGRVRELYNKNAVERRWDIDMNDRGCEFFNERDDSERRWDMGINDRGRKVYSERDDNARRWDIGNNDWRHEFYNERVDDERRWDIDISDRGCELYNRRDDYERRWDIGINDGGHEFYKERDDNKRRRDVGISDRGHELYDERDNNERRWNIDINDWGHRALYCEGDDDDEKILDYGSNYGALLRLENRQQEFLESDLDLGRFSGRLGRGVSKGEFIRPKKKRRMQRESALHRIQLGKACSWHSGGYKCQHLSKESSSGSFRGKQREGFGWLDTRMEDKREREQSPMELAISFKSNGLVAKAILVPSSPAVESDIYSMPRNMNIREVNSLSGSPLDKSSKDMVKTDLLTRGLDFRSDSQGTSSELLDKSTVSGSGSETANDANDLGKSLRETSLKMTEESGEIINANTCISNPSAVPQLNSNTKFSKGNISSASIGMVPDILLPLLGGTDDVAGHAHGTFISNQSTGHADSLGFSQNANNDDTFVHNWGGSVLDPEKNVIESIDRFTSLGSDRVDNTSEHHFLDGRLLLENALNKGPSEVMVSTEGRDIAGSSRPQETRLPEVQEDKYFSEIHESFSASKSDSALLQKPENVIVSGVGSADANSKEFSPKQVNEPDVGANIEESRSLEGAVTDCANFSLVTATSTNFLPEDRKGIIAPEAMSNVKTSESIEYSSKIKRKRKARRALMDVSGAKTNVVVDNISSIGGEVARVWAKDSISAVEVDFSGEKESCKVDNSLNEGPSGVEDSTLEVDFGADGSFPGYSKKRKVVSPRWIRSSLSEDDSIADGLTSDCSKLDQGSTRLPEWGADQRQDTRSSASAGTSKCGTTDMENKAAREKFYVADMDKTLADGNKLHANDDPAFIPNNISLSADGNGVCTSSSDDELLVSNFDMRSCMSSTEDLLSYSDRCFSRNTKASVDQLKDHMICGRDKISNRKPVSTDPNTFSLGKSLEKAASDSSQTNAYIPPPQDNSKVVPKSNLVHGKLTLSKNQLISAAPKVFHGLPPLNVENSRKFHSTHLAKSRTWHRTGNCSVAVTEPKLQLCPLPQTRGTKTTRSVQSSYVRKGNSLVRKPSASAITPGFHGLSSSVYRLTPCTDISENSQSSDSKTGDVDAPTLFRIEQVKTSEMPKSLQKNHSGKSLNCTSSDLGESLPVANPPRNGCPLKTLDVSEETIKSSAVPECQTGSVNNSGSLSTLDEGNSGKKIMYVKRRSNQLVAASGSEDASISGVDKTEASLFDGYYKRRKNQLLRASSANHVKKGDGNVNSHRLTSQATLPRSSSKRLSGFAKIYRSSKFSCVWKLHDTQSSQKQNNSVGPQKMLPYLVPWKRATYWRSFRHALGSKPNSGSFPTTSQKLLLSRKRGAVYTRSTHGYSLRMSKVLSVGGSSLKWSKSIERNSKKANEEATRAVAAAEKRKKEEKGAVTIASKSRNHVSRERIFRIGLERYKMDPTRRTLHRITEKEPSSSDVLQSEKNVKRSYVPKRLLIGNDEYVRIGNGNQLVRDPKKRTRVLANEKVRWSLRTARLRLARKKKYCQFYTRFGKCNKDDGKCPYIHDPSKIAVCTKFLNGSCSNLDCKLTHKVIPERMQDCSYFLKGSCSNENCPYRHVNLNPDSTVCESFLRGYCADGNECQKKHTYVCPAFEATGTCPQATTCKLHHPKKKIERKPLSEQKIVRGRYFDGGLIGLDDSSVNTTEKLSAKGKDDIVCQEGKYPDYISLDVSDEEVEHTLSP